MTHWPRQLALRGNAGQTSLGSHWLISDSKLSSCSFENSRCFSRLALVTCRWPSSPRSDFGGTKHSQHFLIFSTSSLTLTGSSFCRIGHQKDASIERSEVAHQEFSRGDGKCAMLCVVAGSEPGFLLRTLSTLPCTSYGLILLNRTP